MVQREHQHAAAVTCHPPRLFPSPYLKQCKMPDDTRAQRCKHRIVSENEKEVNKITQSSQEYCPVTVARMLDIISNVVIVALVFPRDDGIDDDTKSKGQVIIKANAYKDFGDVGKRSSQIDDRVHKGDQSAGIVSALQKRRQVCIFGVVGGSNED